jgi:hypothetical protein
MAEARSVSQGCAGMDLKILSEGMGEALTQMEAQEHQDGYG